MKKLITTALVTGLVLALGAGFAQPFAPDAEHGVTIQIPDVLFLRITDGTDNEAVTGTVVNFDFASTDAAINEYLDWVDGGGGWIGSTDDVDAFGDVIVFSNRDGWSVTVVATAFATAGFSLDNVQVEPSGTLNLATANIAGSWTLSTTLESIASNGAFTQGWKSLGFSAGDYAINLDGTEEPGTYETLVTYTIAQP